MAYSVRIERVTKPIHLFLNLEKFFGNAGARNENLAPGSHSCAPCSNADPGAEYIFKIGKVFWSHTGNSPAI